MSLDKEWDKLLHSDIVFKNPDCSPKNLLYVYYTSGSTGAPKGVMGNHEGFMNRLYWMWEKYPFSKHEICCLKTSISFLDSMGEIFGSLLKGIPLVVAPKNITKDPKEFNNFLNSNNITRLVVVPTLLNMMTQYWKASGWFPKKLKMITSSGDELTASSVKDLFALKRNILLLNLYGSTEVAADVTYYEVRGPIKDNLVPIGRPISNMEVYVLDKNKKPCAVGEVGEIYIAGVGLSDGYIHDIKLTKKKFITIHFIGVGKKPFRVFRTGDLAKWLTDGQLQYLGRSDEQIKIRGFRVELQEIRSALAKLTYFKTFFLMSLMGNSGKKLLLYYVLKTTRAVSVDHIKRDLENKLPHYMVPELFMCVDKLPLLPSGKVDKNILFDLYKTRFISRGKVLNNTGFLESPLEEELKKIISSRLGIYGINPRENIFDFGANSFIVSQIVMDVNQKLNSTLSIADIFENPSIRKLQKLIKVFSCSGVAPKKARASTFIPLSPYQEQLWFFSKYNDQRDLQYNIPFVYDVEGSFDIRIFRKSWEHLVNRHASLRTVFIQEKGSPYQVVKPALDFVIRYRKSNKEDIRKDITKEIYSAFDLEKGPLLRVSVIKMANTSRHIVIVVIHHIICDGWSINLLFKELSTLYRAYSTNTTPAFERALFQYADFVYWQKNQMEQAVFDKKMDYWIKKLSKSQNVNYKFINRRPVHQINKGRIKILHIHKNIVSKLRAIARSADCSMFMVMLTVINILSAYNSDSKKILLGAPIASRPSKMFEKVVGLFVNMLVLSSNFSDSLSFLEFLLRSRLECINSYANQDVPFNEIVNKLKVARDTSYHPIVQTVVIFNESDIKDQFVLPGLTIKQRIVRQTYAKYDLTFIFNNKRSGNIELQLEYNVNLFCKQTIDRLLQQFTALLNFIVEKPETPLHSFLAKLNEGMLDTYGIGGRKVFHGEKTISNYINQPSHILGTIHDEGKKLTGEQLKTFVLNIAFFLKKFNVENKIVGILLYPGSNFVLSVLGIIQAGAVYLPLDPDYPMNRISYMVRDSKCILIITDEKLLKLRGIKLPKSCNKVFLDKEWKQIIRIKNSHGFFNRSPKDLLYVYYTSGSTGFPKGVMGNHEGFMNKLYWMWDKYPYTKDEVCCLKSPLSFIDSATEMFSPLLAGIPLVIAPYNIAKDPHVFNEFICENKITRLIMVPALLDIMVQYWQNNKNMPEKLRMIISSGDVLTPYLIRKLFRLKKDILLLNLYGSTEVAGDVTGYEIRSAIINNYVPIGKPIYNMRTYVLDKDKRLCSVGERGELYVSGVGLADGYIYDPVLTREKFITNHFVASDDFEYSRMFKTGDIVSWLPNGELRYFGRSDEQIKIRGFRIDVSEVQTKLKKFKGITEVLVKKELVGTNKQECLVAYYLAPRIIHIDQRELKLHLADTIPNFMIPTYFVKLDKLPMNLHGKLDTLSLTKIRKDLLSFNINSPPTNELENNIHCIWCKILNHKKISVTENFFDVGGTSILMVKLQLELEKQLHIKCSIVELYQYSTIRFFAEYLKSKKELWHEG